MSDLMAHMDLMKLVELFPDDGHCRTVLEKLRWPNGVTCLRCNGTNIRRNYTRDVYDCATCGYQFSVLVGTIFSDTHLPLRKWFVTTYLMCESKKSISALQIKRTIKVSYKTAWYLCHRIRAAMDEANPAPLTGTVEVDETYVGGKVRGKGHGYKGNKTIVAGAVQRGGEVRMRVVQHADRKTLHQFIDETAPDADAIYTDEWQAYNGIGRADRPHETVNHHAEEWVRGVVHTNTAESVWSLFDRSVIGAYHHLSVKHMGAYLNEQEWRFNNRDNPYLFRDTLMKLLTRDNLTYQALVFNS